MPPLPTGEGAPSAAGSGRGSRGTAVPALAAAIFLVVASPLPAAPPVLQGLPSIGECLDLGMPLSAALRFERLPEGEKWKSPLLPRLLEELSAAGYPDRALGLYARLPAKTAEPARSGSHLAAGKIHWRQGNREEALRALRQVSGDTPFHGEASLLAARALASSGDPSGARAALRGAPAVPERALLELALGSPGDGREDPGSPRGAPRSPRAGEPEEGDAAFLLALRRLSLRTDPEELSREILQMADSPGAGEARRVAALTALARNLLVRKEPEKALSAARRTVDRFDPWRRSVREAVAWDGTLEGARETSDRLADRYPFGEDARDFRSAGERFLARATLLATGTAVENGARHLARRVRDAESGVRRVRETLLRDRARVESLLSDLARHGTSVERIPEAVRDALDEAPLSELGEREDPRAAALLRDVATSSSDLERRIRRTTEAFGTRSRREWSPLIAPEDRIMVIHAQMVLDRIDNRFDAVSARVALLKGQLFNRWKERYRKRAEALLSESERSLREIREREESARRAWRSLEEGIRRAQDWERALARHAKAAAAAGERVAVRRAQVAAAATGALEHAERELVAAISRREGTARYLAGRAAAERILLPRTGGDGGPAPGGERAALREEAIGHLEAALSPGGDRVPPRDETLYLLGELRLDGYLAARYASDEPTGPPGGPEAAISRFRQLLGEHPDSPYVEAAYYGLATCYEESGRAENAAGTLSELARRFPRSRYSDEVRLRLGEYAFDAGDYPRAEENYRLVGGGASPELRATAAFKRGWALYLMSRPAEAGESFLASLLASDAARGAGGAPKEAVRMAARSLVEAGTERDAERILARANASAHGPDVLLGIQEVLSAQNRYEEAVLAADRIGAAWPGAPQRVDAEIAAAEALRKANRPDESHRRKGTFSRVFGPGSRWQAFPERTPADIARANVASEDGLRSSAFHFHARSREKPPGDRASVLAAYDEYLALFPQAQKAGEVAYQRAWLLYEDGRKKDAGRAFEEVAARHGGERQEPSRWMALQCAKDLAGRDDPASQEAVVRLAYEYERAHPASERLPDVLLDRARAHANRKEHREAAGAALRAADSLRKEEDRRAALRLAGDSLFESSEWAEAEKAFRGALALSPGAAEREDLSRWVAFCLFRRAESLPDERASEAGDLFRATAREFPSLPVAWTALFRAGRAYAGAGRTADAIRAFREVEEESPDATMSRDATRWLASLYEANGERIPAAKQYELLAATEPEGETKWTLHLHAAELRKGEDEAGFRRSLLAAAAVRGVPPGVRIDSLFRAAESFRAAGMAPEADRAYERTVAAQRESPGTLPETAGRALFRRAEYRLGRFRDIAIAPPLEKTFAAKQKALEETSSLYLEAIRLGDAETVSASLHRLGEGFEEFRTAILSSPPPKGLTEAEREEYAFLLEERAAPIEEKAVEAYARNLRQAVALDLRNEWVGKSRERLVALRPARFAKRFEFAFPVATLPGLVGIVERPLP